jgi:hypothetical protein
MKAYLDHLLDEGGGDGVEMQIIFQPGMGANAGAVRRVKGFDGLYEMLTWSAPADVPQQIAQRLPKEQLLAVSMFFEADAVQRIMKEQEQSNITLAHPGDIPQRPQ